jgi:hypothetical protein
MLTVIRPSFAKELVKATIARSERAVFTVRYGEG